jgi:dipeptidyl aminopeptidase/acylaminoacyl peptidase
MTIAQRRPITIEDLNRLQLVGTPQISPDGQQIAYAVSTIHTAVEENTYRSALYLAPTDGSTAPRRLTNSGKQDRSPAWSPDGKRLAFVSDRAGKPQIYLLNLAGGEAQQLTDAPNGAGDPQWSPDGTQILYSAKIDATEQQETPKGYKPPLVINTLKHKFDGEGYFDTKRRHLFVIPAAGGAARQLTAGDWNVGGAQWSPDGQQIAYTANQDDDRDSSDINDLWIVTVDGAAANARKVTHGRGPVALPSWSPDGQQIAYIGHEGGYVPGANNHLLVVAADGSGTASDRTSAFDRSVGSVASGDAARGIDGQRPVWSPDGKSLYFVATDGGDTGIYRTESDGNVTLLISGERSCASFTISADGETVAFTATNPAHPNEIFVASMSGANERQVTRHNEALLNELNLQPAERITYESTGGATIEGWIIKPADFDPASDKKYPLMMKIHGGPHALYGNSFSHEFQLLVAQGYVLLYVNPRGSGGYSQEFAHCIRADWGNLDYDDIMAGVDHAIAQGYVDPERLAAGGASYGGYMTCWLLGHTDRFKAIVTERVVSNFVSFWGTSDIGQTFGAWELGGKTPREDLETYVRCSPITYMDRATTPTLIIHGEMDLRCPMEQSEQLFITLKRAGVPVEFVRYPDESHNHAVGGQPTHRTDRLERVLAWLDTYL